MSKNINSRTRSPEQEARRQKRRQQVANVGQKVKRVAKDVWDENKDVVKEVAKQVGHSVLRAIIKQNPEGWYVKYGKITPAMNTSRPMDAIFNTAITKLGTNGSFPKYIDVNISWGEFFNSHAFSLIVEKAMQSLRSQLRSNLPYGIDALRRYIANSITLGCIAKQFERDVLWNQFTSSSMRNFTDAWRTSIEPYLLTTNGLVDTIHHSYLDNDQWAKTIALYDQIAFQVGTNIKLPPSLLAFIDHYFANIFVSEPQVDKAQVMRLRINEMPLIMEDNTTQRIDILRLTAEDLFDLLRNHIIESSIIIADLEKSSNIRGLTLRNYDSRQYNFVYDETFLQAIENGYTSPSAVTDNGYLRMDARYKSSDPYTQFIFMGGVQNWFTSSAVSYVPAFTIDSMLVKMPTTGEVEWPLSLCGSVALDSFAYAYESHDERGTFSTVSEDGMIVLAFNFTSDINPSVEISANYNVTQATNYVISSLASICEPISTALVAQGKFSLPRGSYTSTVYDASQAIYISNGYEDMQVASTNVCVGALIYQFGSWGVYMAGKYGITRSTFDRFSLNGSNSLDQILLVHDLTNSNDAMPRFFAIANAGHATDNDLAGYMAELGLSIVKAIDASSVRWSMRVDNLIAYSGADRKGLDLRSVYVTFGGDNAWNAIRNVWSNNDPAAVGITGEIYIGGNQNAWYFVDNALGVIEYSQPISVGVAGSTDVIIGPIGLAGYIADNLDVHIPIVYKPSVNVLVNLSTPGGSATESPKLLGSPILIKESADSYYYNILDLEPVLYKMFTSLFSLEDPSGEKDNDRNRKR